MPKFYVTTSLPYTTAVPHLGHALELVQADTLARYHRQTGDDVWFLTGTDEHGAKVDRGAKESKMTQQHYVDGLSESFRELKAVLNLSNDQFIRTTDEAHKKAAQKFWKACEHDIYSAMYEGEYCVDCETFYTKLEAPKKVCPIHDHPLEHMKQKNYFFKLSKYTEQVKEVITNGRLRVMPESRRNEILALLERGLEDISISREKTQLGWGIPVPDDADQVMYVWFDALTNYVTALGYPEGEKFQTYWPADYHLIGKDILRHHAAIWPAMLLSAGLDLPEAIYAHGWVHIGGEKLSKSKGNGVTPQEVITQYGVDALRYYLLREISSVGDGDFSWERMEALYNADLANDLGNLVQRVAVMINKYLGGKIDELPRHSHDTLVYQQSLQQLRFDLALDEVWSLVRGLNQFIEEEQPWHKTKDDKEGLKEVLHHAVTDLNQIATLLLPFMPTTAERIVATFVDGEVHDDVGLLFPKAEGLGHSTFKVG